MKKCAISGLDHPRIASRGAARSSTPSRNCRNCNFRGLSVIASQRAALMRGRTADYAVANPPYGPGLCSSALRSRIRAGLVGPRVRGQGRCRDDPLWPGVCFAPSRARALLRVRSVRLISEGIAAVVQGRIAEAVAADTGRCRLALLHCVKPATGHVAGHILPAKLGRAGLFSAHRAKRGNGDYCRDGRDFQKCSHHHLFMVWV
jgi:hypothetical protein